MNVSKIIFIFLLFPLTGFAQTISTYVGNGVRGVSGDGGLATNAKLSIPIGLNFDLNGNLMLCQGNLVREVNLYSKIIASIAGDTSTVIVGNGGPATAAQVNNPYSVCVDASGNYYIADYWTSTIRKVDKATGIIDVYVGTTKMSGSSGDGGPATAARIGGAGTVCIDTVRKILYLTDGWNFRVRQVNMKTGIITNFAGTGIKAYSGDGGPATAADMSRVFGMYLDRMGNVYINDWDNARIRKVDILTGIITTIAGNGMLGYSGDGGPATAAMIQRAIAICMDTCENIYFADEANNRIRRIDAATGIITTIAGKGTRGFSGDGGPALAAEFDHVEGMAMDTYGSIYVSDYYNHRIRKITPDAKVTCYEGNSSLAISNADIPRPSIYPNPATDILNIGNLQITAGYRLLSMVGAVLQQGGLNEGNNTINIAELPVGMYLVEVSNAAVGLRMMYKIVKQ